MAPPFVSGNGSVQCQPLFSSAVPPKNVDNVNYSLTILLKNYRNAITFKGLDRKLKL